MTVLEQITYTPTPADANERPFTFCVMVDEEAFQKRQKEGPGSVALANVVDSFEVLRYDNPGKSGKMVKPSNRELEDVFGTSDDVTVVERILEQGSLHKNINSDIHNTLVNRKQKDGAGIY